MYGPAGSLYYGSGFPDDGGPARLAPQATLDLMLNKALGRKLSLSLTALNVTNRHVLLDNSPTFGGTHFNNPARCSRRWLPLPLLRTVRRAAHPRP